MTACTWEIRAKKTRPQTAHSSHRSGRLRHTILKTIDTLTIKPQIQLANVVLVYRIERTLSKRRSFCLSLVHEPLHLCLSVQTLLSKEGVGLGQAM